MRAGASAHRSTTSTSALTLGSSSPTSSTSCPAALSAVCRFEPNSRSGTKATTRATLLSPQSRELLAHRLGPAPHLHHLGTPGADLTDGQLSFDPGLVQELERRMHRLRRRGVTEAMSHQQPPVP